MTTQPVSCSECKQTAMLVDAQGRPEDLEGLQEICNVCKRPGTVRTVPSQGGYVLRFMAARARYVTRSA